MSKSLESKHASISVPHITNLFLQRNHLTFATTHSWSNTKCGRTNEFHTIAVWTTNHPKRLTYPSPRIKHINSLWQTNPNRNRDCADANGSPILADTLNVVTLITSATNGSMFFRREDLWFHVCLGLKREQRSHTCTVTLAHFALGGGCRLCSVF